MADQSGCILILSVGINLGQANTDSHSSLTMKQFTRTVSLKWFGAVLATSKRSNHLACILSSFGLKTIL